MNKPDNEESGKTVQAVTNTETVEEPERTTSTEVPVVSSAVDSVQTIDPVSSVDYGVSEHYENTETLSTDNISSMDSITTVDESGITSDGSTSCLLYTSDAADE